ncbi:MAG: dihydroneopterin aldolase [Xanthobacteraceae bacterium]
MGDGPGIAVVKLGGSYAGSAELKSWLNALTACAGHVVLVPGGGPFADTVRDAQRSMGFDDRAAHHMALIAMEQYGYALTSLGRRLARAASLAAIRRALGAGKVPVWSPARMVLAAADVPCSWDVTADSLAAWLAGRLGAKQVLLVKQIRPPGPSISARDLVARGLVDPAFPAFLEASGAAASVAGPADHAQAAAAIRSGSPCGIRIQDQAPLVSNQRPLAPDS